MVFFLAAFGLLLHLLVWGAGAALLLTPRAWRNAWPIFCAPMGLALQSAVVWAGAYSNLAGTAVYARGTELIPLLLLALAVGRVGAGRVAAVLSRYWALGLVMAVDLGLLVLPLARASRTLTTSSLGSCDAADYAAGARVLQEFSRNERGGFIGLTEVVRVASVDNFYDFWLRLNHFTPSALIAFNGAVFGWQPHEITGLMTILLLVATLPAVYWLARTVLRASARTSLWLAAIYGLNPVTWYAVAHVAMGQLLAAPALAFLTWAGVALWRGRLTWRRGWALGGVLAMAYWLVLGGYNFIVLVGLVPALTYAGGEALRTGRWRKFGQWLVLMLVPLGVCGLVFTQRTLGLVERFQLFGQYDFGWTIPVMSPEGWLGAVAGTELGPLALGLRLPLLALLLAGLLLAWRRDRQEGRREGWWALAMMLPVIAGYAYLELRGALLGTHASYDAYKLLAVFFPGLLCGLCVWTSLARSRQPWQRWAARLGVVGITAANLVLADQFSTRLRRPPLQVDADLVALQRIETLPDVASINLQVADFWSRLWANAFLLRKPQYFPTHTYEGRLNTALKGDWDLTSGVLAVVTPAEAGSVRIGRSFRLLNRHSPYFLRVQLGEGWHPEEHLLRESQRWHWSKGEATLRVENPQATLRTVTLRLLARSLQLRDLQVWQGGACRGVVAVGTALADSVVAGVVLPPGETVLTLRSSQPPTAGTAADARALGFAVYRLELEVQPLPAPPAR